MTTKCQRYRITWTTLEPQRQFDFRGALLFRSWWRYENKPQTFSLELSLSPPEVSMIRANPDLIMDLISQGKPYTNTKFTYIGAEPEEQENADVTND